MAEKHKRHLEFLAALELASKYFSLAISLDKVLKKMATLVINVFFLSILRKL